MRCRLFRTILIAGCLVMGGQVLQAQAPPAPPPVNNSTRVQRQYYVEGGVVVLLMGAAIYAVCRSSRRV